MNKSFFQRWGGLIGLLACIGLNAPGKTPVERPPVVYAAPQAGAVLVAPPTWSLMECSYATIAKAVGKWIRGKPLSEIERTAFSVCTKERLTLTPEALATMLNCLYRSSEGQGTPLEGAVADCGPEAANDALRAYASRYDAREAPNAPR